MHGEVPIQLQNPWQSIGAAIKLFSFSLLLFFLLKKFLIKKIIDFYSVKCISVLLMMLENQQWATRQTRDHNDTCTTQKREDLTESTRVVPAEYPPKVKLELLTTLEC